MRLVEVEPSALIGTMFVAQAKSIKELASKDEDESAVL